MDGVWSDELEVAVYLKRVALSKKKQKTKKTLCLSLVRLFFFEEKNCSLQIIISFYFLFFSVILRVLLRLLSKDWKSPLSSENLASRSKVGNAHSQNGESPFIVRMQPIR